MSPLAQGNPVFGIGVRLGRVLRFSGHYLAELVRSGVRVARDVLSPGTRARPGIVRLPLDTRSDFEIALVANLISLTPGTLSVDVEEDRTALLVHVMFLEDGNEEEVIQNLRSTVEEPILALIR
jgi:multicomponent Na+:H+ antiporter subunit E